jgi:hypothetical protein
MYIYIFHIAEKSTVISFCDENFPRMFLDDIHRNFRSFTTTLLFLYYCFTVALLLLYC